MQRIPEIKALFPPKRKSNHQHRAEDQQQEVPQFFIFQRFPHRADQDEIVEVEVQPEEDHEHSQHILDRPAVKAGDAVRFGGKAACPCRRKRMQQRIIKAHTHRKQNDRFDQRQTDIDHIENHGSMAGTRNQFAYCRSGNLRTHDVHRMLPAHGQYRHQEDQHTHSANPVGEHPPEHYAPRHAVEVRQYRGSGRREARDGLEQGIDIVRYAAGEYKRQGPYQ